MVVKPHPVAMVQIPSGIYTCEYRYSSKLCYCCSRKFTFISQLQKKFSTQYSHGTSLLSVKLHLVGIKLQQVAQRAHALCTIIALHITFFASSGPQQLTHQSFQEIHQGFFSTQHYNRTYWAIAGAGLHFFLSFPTRCLDNALRVFGVHKDVAMNMELSQGGRGTCVQCYKLKIFLLFLGNVFIPGQLYVWNGLYVY